MYIILSHCAFHIRQYYKQRCRITSEIFQKFHITGSLIIAFTFAKTLHKTLRSSQPSPQNHSKVMCQAYDIRCFSMSSEIESRRYNIMTSYIWSSVTVAQEDTEGVGLNSNSYGNGPNQISRYHARDEPGHPRGHFVQDHGGGITQPAPAPIRSVIA